jgi:hypothetical protein
MNGIPEIIPPDQKTEQEEFFILVELRLPCIPGLTPQGSRLATVLTGQLMAARLQQNGVHVTLIAGSGEHNDSVYTLKVDKLAPALDAIKAALHSAYLLSFAQIGYYDTREEMLRIDHPVRDAKPLALAALQLKIDAHGRFLEDLMNFMLAAIAKRRQ